jgi:hypothetical protein
LLHKAFDVAVNMEDEIDQQGEEFHADIIPLP